MKRIVGEEEKGEVGKKEKEKIGRNSGRLNVERKGKRMRKEMERKEMVEKIKIEVIDSGKS